MFSRDAAAPHEVAQPWPYRPCSVRQGPNFLLEIAQSPRNVSNTAQDNSVSTWEGGTPFPGEDYVSEMARHLPEVTQLSGKARAPGFSLLPSHPLGLKSLGTTKAK